MSHHSHAPLVSIGMPVYNGEKYIRRALDSLLAQDYPNCELIISDNASTDDTWRICREYESRSGRMVLHRNDSNQGAMPNFKKVLNLAAGRYFFWAAVDDEWRPDFVSKMVQRLEADPGVVLSFCAIQRVEDSGQVFDGLRFLGKNNPNLQGPWRLSKALLSGKKTNIFIYGLFRTDPLKKSISLMSDSVSSGERWFLLQFALAGKFSYVDEFLYRRTYQPKPYHQRYPEDRYSRASRKAGRRIFQLKPIRPICRTVINSPIVPLKRKLLLPLLVCYFIYSQLSSALGSIVWQSGHSLAKYLPQKFVVAVKSHLFERKNR